MSNALVKSSEMTMTYGLDSSMSVIVCRRQMMAAAGEPVGRNANWSEKESDGGGDRKAA